ncbi:LacI family DNA-binding transcriptional regulator [Kineococcus sp. SYSU DK001]|uniref:LacI family DNA-binding transcriptional regulator n=1 Tax=Kineococcus sp. SYSU DK001 TaxID=3383122 RepID=UPI003D7E46F4
MAGAAGVSPSTVSKVVRGVPGVSAGVHERVDRAVAELDYRPHLAGRSLSTGANHQPVTVAVPTLVSAYHRRLAGELIRAARSAGLRSVVVETSGAADVEADLLAAAAHRRAPLLLASPHPRDDPSCGAVPAVLLTDLPVGRPADGPRGAHPDRVAVDSAGAADLCTTHLLQRGRRRLALVGSVGGAGRAGGGLREQGFRRATRRFGVTVPAARARPLPRWTTRHGVEATTALVRADPALDGIVAVDDQAAVGVLHALRTLGRRVPDDVAVTGVDDDLACDGSPALTSVLFPVREMAGTAVLLLGDRIAGADEPGRTRVFTGELVVRPSSSVEPHLAGEDPVSGPGRFRTGPPRHGPAPG